MYILHIEYSSVICFSLECIGHIQRYFSYIYLPHHVWSHIFSAIHQVCKIQKCNNCPDRFGRQSRKREEKADTGTKVYDRDARQLLPARGTRGSSRLLNFQKANHPSIFIMFIKQAGGWESSLDTAVSAMWLTSSFIKIGPQHPGQHNISVLYVCFF